MFPPNPDDKQQKMMGIRRSNRKFDDISKLVKVNSSSGYPGFFEQPERPNTPEPEKKEEVEDVAHREKSSTLTPTAGGA